MILENLKYEFRKGWITRDIFDHIEFYEREPKKIEGEYRSNGGDSCYISYKIFQNGLFNWLDCGDLYYIPDLLRETSDEW